MNTLIAYFQNLAREHRKVMHADDECHFSALQDEAQNSYARTMHYPCVTVEMGDIYFTGSSDAAKTEQVVTLFFLDHVTDAGDYEQIQDKFDLTCGIMKDFVRRMIRDRRNGVTLMARFDPSELEAHAVYLESAGLYGWALFARDMEPFSWLDCDGVWMDE